jgi:hypothetical protein
MVIVRNSKSKREGKVTMNEFIGPPEIPPPKKWVNLSGIDETVNTFSLEDKDAAAKEKTPQTIPEVVSPETIVAEETIIAAKKKEKAHMYNQLFIRVRGQAFYWKVFICFIGALVATMMNYMLAAPVFPVGDAYLAEMPAFSGLYGNPAFENMKVSDVGAFLFAIFVTVVTHRFWHIFIQKNLWSEWEVLMEDPKESFHIGFTCLGFGVSVVGEVVLLVMRLNADALASGSIYDVAEPVGFWTLAGASFLVVFINSFIAYLNTQMFNNNDD